MRAQLKDLISNSDVILCLGGGGGGSKKAQAMCAYFMYDP